MMPRMVDGEPAGRRLSLRELGARVRRAREHFPRELTQARAGELIGRSRRWWQDLEGGRLDPQIGDLERVAALLGRQLGELLGLKATTATSSLDPEAEDTRRRTFLVWLASLPVAMDTERLAAVLGAPLSVDRRVLDDLDAQGHEYGRMYWAMSPASFWPTVYGYTVIARQVHAAAPGTLAQRAGEIASRATALLGMLAHRLHRRADAVMYLNLAAELADEADDGPLQAHALVALRAIYSPVTSGKVRTDASHALRLLDEAEAVAGAHASPLLLTWLHACRAEDHALLDHTLEAERDLEAAERSLSQAPRQVGGFFDHWNPGRLAGFRGNCHVLLRQPAEAIEVLEAVARETSRELIGPYTAVLSDLAAAYAQRGDVDRAGSLLSTVLTTAQRANVPERAGRVWRVRGAHLARWPDAPAVRHLDAQLQHFIMARE